ncbi:hypothetical protein [Krasilnikovia cinnamomea]|uniref:hypothetical protein n=1 Tax=Krasilnikovia cinnamomea TaxID=349313 RepID=UPI00102B61E7|nr:hypothetical protein [Krasilnikovia cinnamomea]
MQGELVRCILAVAVMLPWVSDRRHGQGTGHRRVRGRPSAGRPGPPRRADNPRLDQVGEIDEKIAAIGDQKWIGVQTSWLANPVTGDPDAARLTATVSDRNRITDQVTVRKVDGPGTSTSAPARHDPTTRRPPQRNALLTEGLAGWRSST